MRIKPEVLMTYCSVMETLNVTKSARHLGVSQPAASKMLNQLEHAVGFPVFKNIRGRLRPTHEGQLFYQHAKQTLASFQQLDIYAGRIKQNETEKLIISAMPAMCNGLLINAIAEYKQHSLSGMIQLQMSASPDVVASLKRGEADIGIAMRVDNAVHYHCHTIEKPRVALVPGNHPLAKKTTVSCNELANHDFIYTGIHSGQDIYSDPVFDSFGKLPNISYQTTAYSIGCHFVARGLACAIVDPFTAESNKALGYNIIPLEEYIPFSFSIIRPKGSLNDEHSYRFMEYLIERWGNHHWERAADGESL